MAVIKLVYCATPARLSDQKHKIMGFVISKGKAPLHPFNALPIEYFETETINRADTLALCCKLIDACDEFWLFGISEGTLIEAEYFFKNHGQSESVKIWINEFDTESKNYAEHYQARFAETLAKLGL